MDSTVHVTLGRGEGGRGEGGRGGEGGRVLIHGHSSTMSLNACREV